MKTLKDLLSKFKLRATEDIFTVILLYITWIIIAADTSLSSLLLGLIISYVAVLVIHSYFTRKVSKSIVTRFFYFVAYAITLVKEVILSSIAVARLALQPKLSFRPTIEKVPTIVEDENKLVTMVILGNSITLTPGTLTIEVDPGEKVFYIHSLDVIEAEDKDDLREKMFGSLETAIRRAFK
ncbi:Na+/H+ antiporter subunit E [Natroniella sulfidigena]|uniref:Na+/H+ antiporter subunit E n=1 Tax=Natroniella sulfidigena TaxID=723921 RepID=UPI00200A82FA|nr:Na+/H+ antiporter subunit E [Natroniella sulfidigena]MCK8816060.1 Na+/H+ antiporter subunit E [Natroniella sulfidigena]